MIIRKEKVSKRKKISGKEVKLIMIGETLDSVKESQVE